MFFFYIGLFALYLSLTLFQIEVSIGYLYMDIEE